MNIGVLTTSNLCLPAIQYLRQLGHNLHLILPSKSNPEHEEVEYSASQLGCSLQKWNEEEVSNNLASWESYNELSIIFVMTFPYLFSKQTLGKIKAPFLNIHYAKLPDYRGAQPVFWIIKNREQEGAVSVHKFGDKVDGGEILWIEKFKLSQEETFGSYHSKAAQVAVKAIHEILPLIQSNKWEERLKIQNEAEAKMWLRPTLEDVTIDWDKMEAGEIDALIRACNPWNKGAITYLNGMQVKILSVMPLNFKSNEVIQPGEVLWDSKSDSFLIFTKNKQFLKLEIAYTTEGFYSSRSLKYIGLDTGMGFRTNLG